MESSAVSYGLRQWEEGEGEEVDIPTDPRVTTTGSGEGVGHG